MWLFVNPNYRAAILKALSSGQFIKLEHFFVHKIEGHIYIYIYIFPVLFICSSSEQGFKGNVKRSGKQTYYWNDLNFLFPVWSWTNGFPSVIGFFPFILNCCWFFFFFAGMFNLQHLRHLTLSYGVVPGKCSLFHVIDVKQKNSLRYIVNKSEFPNVSMLNLRS